MVVFILARGPTKALLRLPQLWTQGPPEGTYEHNLLNSALTSLLHGHDESVFPGNSYFLIVLVTCCCVKSYSKTLVTDHKYLLSRVFCGPGTPGRLSWVVLVKFSRGVAVKVLGQAEVI